MKTEMTAKELMAHVEKTVCGILDAEFGKRIGDVVREKVEASLVPMKEQQTSWMKGIQEGMDSAQASKMVKEIKREPGQAFARCLRAGLQAKIEGQSPNKAVDYLHGWGDKDLADAMKETIELRTKALSAGDAVSGGFLVPQQFSQEIIDILRPMTVVRRFVRNVIPMPVGNFKIPKQTGGVNGSYIGENTNATKQQPTFGQITLSFKKLAVLVPISNDLIRYSSPSSDSIVRNDIVRGLAVREDQAFLRDNGGESTPKGLRFWLDPTTNLLTATSSTGGTTNLAKIVTDLGKMIVTLANANVPMTAPAWLWSPRSEIHLMTLLNTQGLFVFRDEMARGTLFGIPFARTTNVPVTLNDGGNGDESEVYLVDFDDVAIGEALTLRLDASMEAAYHDGSSVVAAYSQDQTVVRAIAEHDIAVRRAQSVCVTNQVRWQ